jgi:outer membrane protein OmpA-like peptidoglycan-associated protein
VDTGTSGATTTAYGPGKIEAGLFLGGFINNYFHQFYDPDTVTSVVEMDRVSPEFGLRFAVFPSRIVGIEAEGSVIAGSTKMSGDGVSIYGLGGQLVLQKPGRVTPFLGLGLSLRHTSSDTLGSDDDVPIHAGVGIRAWLSKSVAIRLDARFLRGPSFPHDDAYTLNASYGEFMLGVSFNPSPAAASTVVTTVVVDPDPDKDGVLGMNDECPQENGGTNPNGCPTKDKDGDGIVDASDKCVDQAETINKFEDEDGCPDTIPDTDADGYDDLVDKCKDQAEDKDAFQDEDGCPDPDNDNDGVLDAKDKCPGTAGPVENSGCPDTDGDADGVVDRLDNCPEEKGDVKNQGCKAKQLVIITKDQLKILDQVKFVTGSAKLSPASNKLLDNIARVLLAHLEIWKVKVDGHTDNVGKPEKNLKLSQDRAQSVVNYLVKKGVAPERLEATGYGDTKPVEDNATAKGKAQNRRVEFNIVNE